VSDRSVLSDDDEFDINGVVYSVGSMPVMKQFHVLRRLAPLITRIPDIIKRMDAQRPPATPESGSEGSADALSVAMDQFDMATIVQPIVDGISEMSDKDSEFVISTCLLTVRRKITNEATGTRGHGWAPVWNRQADAPQYQDMDLTIILQLVFKVLMKFAAPFSSVLASPRS
jgi:hypothetical protein